MLKSSKWRLCLLASLSLCVLVLAACGGGGGGGATDTGAKKTAVSGTVSFPSLSMLVGKRVASTSTTIDPDVKLIIYDLSGNEIARPTLTVVDKNDPRGYTYTASLDSSKDYIFKALWGGQILRTLADKSALSALAADIKVTPITTATVLVVEKSLALTPGTLGTTSANAVAVAVSASLAALPPKTIETNITTALAACTSTSGTATAAQAELASLANIVEAVIKTKVDAAVFMADTTSAATVTAVTYTQSGTTVTGSSTDVAPAAVDIIANTITASLPKITSASSATFTAGTAGSFTVTGNGTLSVWGTLPSGVTFDANSGVLSGTPATGSNGTYSVTFTATSNDINATQKFTLTVNAPAPVFTSEMISGKTFTYSMTYLMANITGTDTFNADNTITSTKSSGSTSSGTWAINSAGQLVVTYTGITETLTLISATSTTLTASYSDPSASGTMTLTIGSPATGGSYSNTSLAGVWLLMSAAGNDPVYFIGDGTGTMIDFAAYNLPSSAGSYSVQADGSFTMTIQNTNNPAIVVSGTLTSATTGSSLDNHGNVGTAIKVADIAACQGTWSGSLNDTTPLAITFSVDANGTITSATGLTAPVTGKMFCDSGKAVAFFRTGATDAFGQLRVSGTLSGSSFSGSFDNDGSAVGTAILTKGSSSTTNTGSVTAYW